MIFLRKDHFALGMAIGVMAGAAAAAGTMIATDPKKCAQIKKWGTAAAKKVTTTVKGMM